MYFSFYVQMQDPHNPYHNFLYKKEMARQNDNFAPENDFRCHDVTFSSPFIEDHCSLHPH